jgi:phosphoglucomutase
MANLHQNPLQEVAGKKIVKIQDYESLTETDLLSGRSTPIALPQSNVVRYVFEDSSWLAIRPSGTEPKCKFYVEVVQKEPRDIKKRVDLIFDSLKRQLHL